ncbi:MAG: HAD-superfamily hydrolase subfamily [Parcubacteria group bacterium]|nr:HAD-superfamily hydrolase subfamily [Parcubacteria group bacterium]
MTPKLVAFDIDQTLTESKSPLDAEMAALLRTLLDKKRVAVISGGTFEQFKKSIIDPLGASEDELRYLYLLPTMGAQLYEYKGGWKEVYSYALSEDEKQKIMEAFGLAFRETGFVQPERIYGVQIEDRGTQITFSALGSDAPNELKYSWDPDHHKRSALVVVLQRELPNFALSIGGTTSIDVTRQGIDKAFGLHELMKHLELSKEEVLFVGDALFPGGNDASVIPTGIPYASEEKPGLSDTKDTIRKLIA